MIERISRDEMYLQVCQVISQRGSCLRAKVGCVITMDNRILSTGYNEPSVNQPFCSEHNCDLNSSCKRAIHAEANAISFAAKRGIALGGSTLYCLYSPCIECAKLIAQSGVYRVVYHLEFRDPSGLEFLSSCGILTDQLLKLPEIKI